MCSLSWAVLTLSAADEPLQTLMHPDLGVFKKAYLKRERNVELSAVSAQDSGNALNWFIENGKGFLLLLLPLIVILEKCLYFSVFCFLFWCFSHLSYLFDCLSWLFSCHIKNDCALNYWKTEGTQKCYHLSQSPATTPSGRWDLQAILTHFLCWVRLQHVEWGLSSTETLTTIPVKHGHKLQIKYSNSHENT